MRLGALFSGGKDSTFAIFLAKKQRHDILCLISVFSENPDSYMFHTPSISQVKKQAERMNLPIIIKKTRGEKEVELEELEEVINKAKEEYSIEGIVTGALQSVYQASRIRKICDKLNLECVNPLWRKDQFELLEDLIKNRFEVIITGVAAYPLDKSWLGRKIDRKFIEDVKKLNREFKINPAGEGGEFETFILNCPLFKKPLKIVKSDIKGSENNYRMEIIVE
jgi:asparagine synthase (glutamine-hydrolysing)